MPKTKGFYSNVNFYYCQYKVYTVATRHSKLQLFQFSNDSHAISSYLYRSINFFQDTIIFLFEKDYHQRRVSILYLINYHSRRNFFSRFTKLSFFNISPRRGKNRCVFPCFARRANDRPIVGNAFTSVRDALKKTCKASDAIVNRKSLSNQKPFRHVRHVHA